MNKVKSWFKRNYIYFSPFLLALYSVIFLFEKNQKEYRPEVLLIPVLISLGFTLIVFVLSKLVFKRAEVASLVSSIIVFVCLSYGRFLELAGDLNFKIGSLKITSELLIGISTSIIVLFLFYLIFKFRKSLLKANKFVFFLSVILLAFPLFNAISYEIKTERLWKKVEDPEMVIFQKPHNEVPGVDKYPDIYYFIFDRYAGKKSLKEQYGFDNSKFLNFLKNKGFYIAENSTTNYPKTFLSLGSSLNMKYLDFLTEETNGGGSSDESIVTPLIRNNDVLHYLQDKGYYYVHIGSWWEPTKKNPNADYQFAPRFREYWGADEFTTGFYDRTIASPILRSIFREPSDVSVDPHNNSHRQAALQQMEEFKKIPGKETPKFVFVHMLLPHDPFVFDKNCNPIPEEVVNKSTHQLNYVNQLQCANSKIENLVEQILSESKKPPVIILQSDEGPFPMNSPIGGDQGWGKADTTALKEKFPILNAYYFPDKDYSNLYDSITPVNSFRIVLNKFFGEKFPLLPDRNLIFQDDNNYYKFTEVTEKIK